MNNSENEYNIYCDESCHLENDRLPIMLLGAIWCPTSAVKKLSSDIRAIKTKYKARGELKWIKVSNAKRDFYLDIIKYFSCTPELNFRCLVVENKERLDHGSFNQGSHDTFYYKMYYSMLKTVLSPTNKYNIYLDIKDTRSKHKIMLLRKILCNNVYDFTKQMIAKIQHIRSHESELLQLADLLIGAVSYINRHLSTNQTKLEIVSAIEKQINHSLSSSTSLFAEKFNIFIFSPTES